MRNQQLCVLLSIICVIFIHPDRLSAQWISDGTGLSTTRIDLASPVIVSDDAGGAILAWRDGRSGNDAIYVQRIDEEGNVIWLSNGKAICNPTVNTSDPTIIADGYGGAIIAWRDYRSSTPRVYVQRVYGNGNYRWAVNGVQVTTDSRGQRGGSLVTNGSGGVIVAFAPLELLAQELDSDGNIKWLPTGNPICTEDGIQHVAITTDGADGAIIVWNDQRGDDDETTYAQRVDHIGNRP